MKVLHIGKYYPPFSGGIENFMALLLPELKAQSNCDVRAIVHQHIPFKTYQRKTVQNIEIIRVPSYGRLLFAPISPTFPYYLNKEIKQFKPDILHIHMPNTSVFWLLLSPLARKIPWVIHWHSDVVSSDYASKLKYAYPFYRPFEQAMLKQCQAIIATSPDYLASSQALAKWQDKSHVIPLGLKLEDLPQLNDPHVQKAEQFWQKGKTRLLSIGRLTYYKGQKYLIEAMQHIPDGQLIIVGIGEQEGALKEQIKSLNLEERVTLSGKLDYYSLHALLKSCDIFCLSSIERTEAFGLVLLEAMAYAKPIIISKVVGSGMNWVTQDKINALFAEKENSKELANQIKSLSNSAEKRQEYGTNGHKRLLKNYKIETISSKTMELYHSLN